MRSKFDCEGSGGGSVRGSTPAGGAKDGLGGGGAADEDEELPEMPMARLDCHMASALGSRACRYERPQKAGHSSGHWLPVACGKGPATSACK